jgi:hypothetical protein
MACMNTICAFNSNAKCTNNFSLCIVRDLYNAQQQTRAYHLYSIKIK